MQKHLQRLMLMMAMLFASWAAQAQGFSYSCDFESDSAVSEWTFVNGTQTNKWFIGTGTHNGGAKGMYVSNDNGTSCSYSNGSSTVVYAYQQFTLSTGSYTLSYDWKANGEGNYDYIRVWLAPASASLTAGQLPNGSTSTSSYTSSTPSGWISLDGGGKLNLSSSWTTRLEDFNVTADGDYKLIIMWCNDGSAGDAPAGAIDNVVFFQPTCGRVSNIVFSNIGVDQVNVSWFDPNMASSFVVRYAPADDASAADSMEVYDTNTTLYGLNPNTLYNVSVVANCADASVSMATSAQVRTACVAIDSLPFVQTFEDAPSGSSSDPSFVNCWSRLTTAAYYYPYVSAYTSYNHTPGGNTGLYWYGTSSYGVQTIVAPPVDTTIYPANNLVVKFWARASSTTYHPQFQVGIISNPMDANTFQLIGTVNVEGTSWAEYEVPTANFTGYGNCVAIRSVVGSSYWYAYVDDITIAELPACPHIDNLAVDTVGLDAIGISWTEVGSASSWVVEYDTVNFVPGAGLGTVETVYDTAFLIENLDSAHTYYIYVHADCGGDTSENRFILARTLESSPAELPFTCDFEGQGNNGFTLLNGSCDDKWYVGTANGGHSAGTKGLYVSSTNGTSVTGANNYNYSFVYAYRDLVLSDTGEYAFSYDWKAEGNGEYDFLRVFLAPASVELRAGQAPLGLSYPYDFAYYTLPNGWYDLAGQNNDGYYLSGAATWQTVNALINVSVPGVYRLYFAWIDEGYGYTPAAVDNISVSHSTCAAPIDFHSTYVYGDTVSLAWSETGSGEYLITYGTGNYRPDTVETNMVIVSGDTSYTFSDLPMGVAMKFYIRSICDGFDSSAWIGPVVANTGFNYLMHTSGTDTLVACGYTISDDGGVNGVYSNNCNATLILRPADPSTQTLMLSGSSYTESTYDYLRIYDGLGTSSTPIFNDYGVSQLQAIDNVVSESGYFTVTFQSDGSVQYDGFELHVQCVTRGNCPRPTSFVLDNVTATDASFSWTDTAATSWALEYGPAGFTPGAATATTVTATSYSETLTGLTPDTYYDVYLYADCGDDRSIPLMLSFHTACVPIDTLPYFESFENGFSGCWYKYSQYQATYPQLNGSNAASGSNSMYFYNYGYNGEHVWMAMPLFVNQLDSLQLKFKMKRASTYTYDYYNFSMKVGVMTDPTDLSTFETIGTYTATNTTTWDSFACYLAAYTGTGRYIAFMDGGTNARYYTYLYIDDITVDFAPECGPVDDIQIAATQFNALVTWTPSSVGNYTGANVAVFNTVDSTWSNQSVSGTYCTLNNLDPETHYEVYVTSLCDGEPASTTSAEFATPANICGAMTEGSADTVALGTGSNQISGIPVNSAWGNTLCQFIITAAELHAAGLDSGTFNGMDFTWTTSNSYNKEFTILMTTTSASSISSTFDPSTSVLCYTGVHPIGTTGTVHYNFDNTMHWNGTDNLLFTTFMNQSGSTQTSSGFYGLSSSVANDIAYYRYKDSSPFTVADFNSGNSGGASSYRPNVVLYSGVCAEMATCLPPAPVVTEATSSSINVAWAPGNAETSWGVYHKTADASNYQFDGVATTNNYTFNGLMPGTNYDFMIVAQCSDDSLSATTSGTTECAKISSFPYTEHFDAWGTGTGHYPNCWNIEGSYSTYPYASTSYAHSGSASMYFYLWDNGTNFCRLTLPEVDTDIQPVNNLQLVFWALQSYDSYINRIEVGVMTNPNNPATFVPVDTVTLEGIPTGEWRMFEVPLNNYTDTGAFITIRSNTISSYTYFYLDDLTVEVIPTCPRPDSLMATNSTANSVDLSWHERGGATDWLIEYGPVGFQLGTGTVVNATSNPFTLAGLPSSYDGEYYVRSVCSSTDTGEYSRYSCRFSTSQIPATIPYSFDVEDASEWANWQQNTNNINVNWFRGTADAYSGTHSFYLSADNGATVSTDMSGVYNVSAWRDIDFGTVDSSFDISFRAKVGGSMTAAYDGLMVFLVDHTVPVVASNSNITSPWGNVNDLYRIATARLDTTWNLYRGTFDNISGVHRVAFFWFNQGTGTADFMGNPAAVDDVVIDYASCPRPTGLDVVSVGATSVTLTWNGPAAANYRVAYRVAGASASTNQYVTTTTNSAMITGLDTLTNYYFFVRRECSATDNSLYSDGLEVSTSMCDGGTIAYSYDLNATANTSNYAPMGYSFYNYGYVQTLVDSAALAGLSGDISAMAFNPVNGTAGTYYNNMNIFLANVPERNLDGGFITPDSTTHQFVQVTHNANLSYTDGGWQVFELDTTFTWDGHSSLLVSVKRDNGTYSSGSNFNVHTTSYLATRYLYQDGGAYDINNPTGGSSGSGNFVGDLQFIACGGVACAAPVIISEVHDYESATITWSGTGTTYEVAIVENGSATWPAETLVTGNTYTFSGLLPATTYTFRVRQDCTDSENGYSAWTMGTFTTDSLPCFAPSNVTVSNITNATAQVAWTANGNETNWEIHVWATGVNDQNFVVNTNPASVNGLVPGVTYSVAVRALCGSALVEGDWSETTTFTTLTCPDVTGLATSNVTFNSVDLNWNSNAMAQGYVVEYGFAGFAQGQGTTVNVNTNSYTVTGLTDETNYDFYVRAVCGTDWYSESWAHVTAMTAQLPDDVVTLTLLVNDPAMGTVSGAGSYAAGTTVSFSATANAGYQFVNWSDGNTEASRSIVLNENMTLTANFASVEGIDVVNGASCTIYPNPATSAATISVAGVNGKVRISVVDMNGRVVATDMLECNADCVKTMDVDNLAQGAYFVRITGENVNMVKKLVVR